MSPVRVQKYAVWARPYGLPANRTFADYLADPVCYLSLYNYKIEALIGPTVDTVERCVSVLDSGSGPNLIKSSMLSSDTLRTLRTDKLIANLAGAGGHRLKTRGIVTLTVKVGNNVARQPFIVVDRLGADAILGTQYIDDHIEHLWIRRRLVVFPNGETVPIQKQLGNQRPVEDTLPRRETYVQDERPPPKLRIAKQVVIQPGTETAVLVQMDAQGEMVLESWGRLYDKHLCAITNGVVNIRRNVPFLVRIANFGVAPVRLPRNQTVGFGVPIPDKVFTLDLDEIDHSATTGLSTAVDPDAKAPLKAPGLKTPEMGTDDIDLSAVPEDQRTNVRAVLKRFEKLWDGRLGQAVGVHHRIVLRDDAVPVRQPPHRAGPVARAAEKAEVDAMRECEVARKTQSEFASPMLLVPKPDGSWRACIDYRKLNDLTVKDSYPIPRMDECLDSLGHAKWFTTLDANSGYWQIPVHPEDVHKTAFVTHHGAYEFTRMPFGLCNAPATFQRTMDLLLSE